MSYSTIAVIYNPNSTGPSKKMAEDFVQQIKTRLPGQKIELIATEYAGHAEDLTYDISKRESNPLIISSSGDGGYNEVVNGAMKAQKEDYSPITGLLPAGNANDHYRNLHTENFVESVARENVKSIDVLKFRGQSKGQLMERYAHSYIGIGITPKVGRELNKTELNPVKEIILAARVFFSVKSTKLKINNKVRRYDSVIFSNIDSMSKYLQISKKSSVTDGKFEITAFRKRHKLKLLSLFLKASIVGVEEDKRVSGFTFETVKKTSIQADGEISLLDANTQVVISAEKQALKCVV